jgi:hypothetical protein
MQTLLSQEEKNQLTEFFRDLEWMFDGLGVERYSYKPDVEEVLLQADHQKMAEDLANIYQKYRDIAEWMK